MKHLFCILLLLSVIHATANAYEESPELARTYAKLKQVAAKKKVQVNIGIVGDSVANNKPKIIRPWFEAVFPKATDGILTYVLEGNATVSKGTLALPWDNAYSFTGEIFTLNAGGSVWFGSGGGWVAATRTVLYYEKGPTLGRFKVQRAIGWGNATWTDEPGSLNVDCAAPSRGWGKIVLNKPFQMTRVRFVHLSGGPVRIPLRPIFRNLSAPGVTFRSLDRGGLALPTAISGDRDILIDYLRELDLDLAFFEMKEDPSYYAEALEDFRDIFDEAKPTTEWIFVGSSPLTPDQDPNQTKQAAENTILEAHATARGGYYFDGYGLIGSYANMVTNNWQGDGIHESFTCSQYLAGKLWEDLGYLTTPPPAPTITAPKNATARRGNLILKGTSTNATLIEFRLGLTGPYKRASGSAANWNITLRGLKPGAPAKLTLRATSESGATTETTVTVRSL